MASSIQKFRNASRRRVRRPSTPASTILRVAAIDPETDTIRVTAPHNTARQLGCQADTAMPLAIRPAESHRQPSIDDLLGRRGNVSVSMKVAVGSCLRGDSPQIEGDTLSVSWVTLGAGADADRNAGGPADIMEGWIRTSRWQDRESGEPRYATELLRPEDAVSVGSMDEVVEAINAITAESLPGRPVVVIRVSREDTRELAQDIFRPGRVGEGAEERLQTPQEVLGEKWADVEEALADGDTRVEVISGRRLSVGMGVRDGLEDSLKVDLPKSRLVRGSSKMPLAEIHADQRLSSAQEDAGWSDPGTGPATERQANWVRSLGAMRGRPVPPEATASAAAASAYIDENKMALGYAPGQLVVRKGWTGKDSGRDPVDIVVGGALLRRTGVPIDAMPSPEAPWAPEWGRSLALQATEERKEAFAAAGATADADMVDVAGPADLLPQTSSDRDDSLGLSF